MKLGLATRIIPILSPMRLERYKAPYHHELLGYSDKIRDLGIKIGSQNRPLSNSREMDVNENQVIYIVDKKLNACQQHYEKKLRDLIEEEEELETALRDKGYMITLQGLTEQCRPNITQMLDRSRRRLLDSREDERAYELTVKSFRQLHLRSDPPVFPASQKAHFITLATIALVEALFNIAFYGEFKGIATAVIIALGASIANVAVSAFFGSLWRFKNSLHEAEQHLGWGYFAFWAAYTFYLNKFVAAFRASLDKLQSDAPNAIALASEMGSQLTFSWPWHGFTSLDITSWFLLIFGVIVAVTSFLKGYNADDPYPQYGSLTRRHGKAKANYQSEEAALYDAVDSYLADADEEIQEIAAEKRELFAAFHEGAQAIYKIFYEYQIDTDAILKDYKHLIKVYRDANKAARNTPVPPAFAKFQTLYAPDLNVPQRFQRKALEKFRMQMQKVLGEIQSACTKTRREVTQMSRSNRSLIDSFLRNIDKEARNRALGIE